METFTASITNTQYIKKLYYFKRSHLGMTIYISLLRSLVKSQLNIEIFDPIDQLIMFFLKMTCVDTLFLIVIYLHI